MKEVFQNKHLPIWCLANLFFAFQFILRLSAGILREDIMKKFSIDAASFGTLAGYYYLGYSGAQIPLGIMLDRLSFRLVTSIAIAATGIGTLTFVTTDSWNLLLFGRFLIGVGSGVAFLSVAKITTTYFEEKYHSLLLGFSFTFGLIGAVFGATPMQLLFDHFGYNDTFYTLSIIAFVISVSMLAFGRIGFIENNYTKNIFSSVTHLLLNPKIILIGISGGLMVGSLEGFADVWAIPFFQQIYGMGKNESRTITSFVYMGMCFGGPFLALSATFLRSTNFMIFLTGTFTIVVFLILFYLSPLSLTVSAILMFFLGILCCYQVLVFTVVRAQVDASNAGLAIAVTNCINMSFGHFFHSVIGNMLASNWNGTLNDMGNAQYTTNDFIYALAIIPICCFIGQLGFGFLALKSRD